MAKRVHLSSAVLIGSLLHAGTVAALGLGDITLNSYLNEPLDAEVRLIDTRDLVADEIKVRLAGVDDFDRLGVDRSYFLTRIQFEVSIDRERNTGVIRLTTDEPVLEPFVDVIIEARWPTGRLLREYTVLVDPPVFREEPLVVSASEEVAATEAEEDDRAAASAPAAEPEAGTGSGDRITTRGSDLPAGEMPQRAFSAETAEAPVPGQRYMVRRDETLWHIASRGRPEGSSVQQAMLDIQRLNPEAFIDGNINRIKAGYIIYLPAEGDISSDDLAEALAEVQEQNTRWASQQSRTPGVTAAASLRISADPVDDAATDAAAGTPSADRGAATDDSARVTAGEEEPAREPAAAGGAPDASEAPAAGPDRSELAGQMAAMSERLDSLEQIVALKDEQIATLEEALREARASAQQTPQPAATPAAERPVAARPAAPAAEPSGGFGMWLYAGAAALLAALAGLLVWRRRRQSVDGDDGALVADTARDDAGEDVFSGVTLRDEPSVGQAPPTEPVRAATPETEPAAEEEAAPARNNRGYGERRYDDYIDDSGGGDALAEADIYIAYGRYLQAAELLNTAIEGEPDNAAYRLKLIELYVDMGEPGQAQEQLDALREIGDSEAVRRGETIVSAIASAAPEQTVPEPAPEAGRQPPREFDDPALETVPASVTPYEADVASTESAADTPASGPSTPVAPPVSAAATDKAPDRSGDESVGDAGYGALEDIEYEPLEFSLDEVDAGGPAERDPGGTAAADAALPDAGVTELELDFDELAIEDEHPAQAPGIEDDELDLSDALREAEAPQASGAGESGSDERDSEDMMFATEADQVATRLDLARAYLDMGDDEGARGILEQVVAAGSDEQQREAQALLDRIG